MRFEVGIICLLYHAMRFEVGIICLLYHAMRFEVSKTSIFCSINNLLEFNEVF